MPLSPTNNIPFETFRYIFQTYEFKIVNVYISKGVSAHKLVNQNKDLHADHAAC